ncbi:MAG: hypothetical protein H6Q51_2682 [Deltaproteobacteria bacterium]|nr:hypothetical protein [Deltaproteobacteria bacterium]
MRNLLWPGEIADLFHGNDGCADDRVTKTSCFGARLPFSALGTEPRVLSTSETGIEHAYLPGGFRLAPRESQGSKKGAGRFDLSGHPQVGVGEVGTAAQLGEGSWQQGMSSSSMPGNDW